MNMYGVVETNTISSSDLDARDRIDYSKRYPLADKRVARITRLRLLTEPGTPVLDLSYCYGELADGTPVLVDLPRHQFTKALWKSQMIDMFKGAGRYALGMGIDVRNGSPALSILWG
jgi:hypothetical protein